MFSYEDKTALSTTVSLSELYINLNGPHNHIDLHELHIDILIPQQKNILCNSLCVYVISVYSCEWIIHVYLISLKEEC